MKKNKKILALAAAAALCLAILAGCGTRQNTPSSSDEPGGAEKNVILVVSFGTSYNDSRDKTIGAVEDAIAAAYPDYEVRRASPARRSLIFSPSARGWKSTMWRRPLSV